MSDTFSIKKAGAVSNGVLSDKVDLAYAGTIDDITLAVGTAPSGGPLTVDVLLNGTSIFPTSIGTLAGTAGAGQTAGDKNIDATQPKFGIALNAAVQGVDTGLVLVIDSEQMLVTAPEQGSNIQGPGNTVTVDVTVQRGYGGTTAATHNFGAAVSIAKATVATGQTSSGSTKGVPGGTRFNQGDTLSLNVLTSNTAADLDATISLTQD